MQRYAKNLPVSTLVTSIDSIHSDRPININFLNLKGIVHVPVYFGNAKEIFTLKDWILGDRCQLVAILGMGGIGKTSLAAKLTLEIQQNFEYVIWHSLRNAPPIADTLSALLQFFSPQLDLDSSDSIYSQISKLMHYLHSFRCLLILDNFGSIFKHGELAGTYREGYETYSHLLHRISEERHQSCLVLTSREQPREIAPSVTARTSV
jgi:NB-ARC domain